MVVVMSAISSVASGERNGESVCACLQLLA